MAFGCVMQPLELGAWLTTRLVGRILRSSEAKSHYHIDCHTTYYSYASASSTLCHVGRDDDELRNLAPKEDRNLPLARQHCLPGLKSLRVGHLPLLLGMSQPWVTVRRRDDPSWTLISLIYQGFLPFRQPF